MSEYAIKSEDKELIVFKHKKHLAAVRNSFYNARYMPFSMYVADEMQYEPEGETGEMNSLYPGLNCFGFIRMSKKRFEKYCHLGPRMQTVARRALSRP